MGELLFLRPLSVVYAQAPSIIPSEGLDECDFFTGMVNAECIPAFLVHLIKFVFGFAGAGFLIMILISGYQIALSGATGSGKEEGVRRLISAIGGFILCTITFFIIDFVISALAGI